MIQNLEELLVGDMTDYERSILRHGAVWFFLILFSYYIIRPIREQIGSTYGTKNLSMLFWATFVAMLIAIPLYSILVGKFKRTRLVPTIYAVFIGSLLAFWGAMRFLPDTSQIWVARAFFVFISVYGLFIVSFFWSVAGDMLSTSQGRRIFGVMAGGGTLGTLLGSLVTAGLVRSLGIDNLLLIPALLLFIALFVYASMERSFKKLSGNNVDESRQGKATGGNPFAGFTAVFQSWYLFAICLFGFFMATCGTIVYFQQSEIVKSAFESYDYSLPSVPNASSLSPEELAAKTADLRTAAVKQASTRYFASVNFAVSLVTLVFQLGIVGWLMKKLGLGMTLAIFPLSYLVGVTTLAISPTLAVVAVISVLGRSAEYGICNPTREVLFTAVNREQRYKAKSFIDTVVRRGGDSAVGGVYNFARRSLGASMTTLSWLLIPIVVAWIGLSLFIGKENRKILASSASKKPQ